MTHNFEIWSAELTAWAHEYPCEYRPTEFHEPGAKLLVRLTCKNQEECRSAYKRVLFEGNPDNFEILNIPAEEFFLRNYNCGLKAGDTVEYVHDFDCISRGTKLQVIEGDIDYPNKVWMKIVSHEEVDVQPGQFASLDSSYISKILKKS